MLWSGCTVSCAAPSTPPLAPLVSQAQVPFGRTTKCECAEAAPLPPIRGTVTASSTAAANTKPSIFLLITASSLLSSEVFPRLLVVSLSPLSAGTSSPGRRLFLYLACNLLSTVIYLNDRP